MLEVDDGCIQQSLSDNNRSQGHRLFYFMTVESVADCAARCITLVTDWVQNSPYAQIGLQVVDHISMGQGDGRSP